MDTSKMPEARLILSGLDGTPLYFVFKTDKGWVGAPGLKKGRYLTDEDVKDGIPYVPAPTPQGERIAMDIRFRQVAHVIGTDPTTWVSESGRTAYGDDEVIELTDREYIEVTADNLSKVIEFFRAEDFQRFDEAGRFVEAELWVRGSVGLVTLSVQPGTRVWRTENLFHVLQPDQHYFQIVPRVVKER